MKIYTKNDEYKDYRRELNIAKKEKKAARLGKPYPKPVKKASVTVANPTRVKAAKERVKELRKARRSK